MTRIVNINLSVLDNVQRPLFKKNLLQTKRCSPFLGYELVIHLAVIWD